MTLGGYILATFVWLSLVVVATAVYFDSRPKRRKAVEPEGLEASVAALKLRLIDLEDKHETYVKRENVRLQRARKEDPQLSLVEQPMTAEQKKADLRRRWAQQNQRGVNHGAV